MSNRRRMTRELLEIYLVHLSLMYRRLILIVGLLLLVYALAAIFVNRIAGFAALIPAIFLLLLQFLQRCGLHRATGSMDWNTLETR